MDETLRQLGELLLGSVPTIIMFACLYAFYTFIVHKPLVKVLAERHEKTEGAIARARADIAAAEARTAEYEQRIREARVAMFKAQEERRQKALHARTEAVAQARSKAQAHIGQVRQAIQKDKEEAMASLQGEAQRLATEIMRTVLRPAMSRTPAMGGQS
jgi:F-type H+-transporting ATPase subunit b